MGKQGVKLHRDLVYTVYGMILHSLGEANIERSFLGGSYCRGRQFCGDVDIALVPKGGVAMAGDLMADFASLHLPVDGFGTKKVSGAVQGRILYFVNNTGEFVQQPVQVDLWICDPDEFGLLSMFVAGSGMFNVRQRSQASRQGYTMGQRYLTEKDTGNQVALPFPEERDVYDFLGWPWVDYLERDV